MNRFCFVPRMSSLMLSYIVCANIHLFMKYNLLDFAFYLMRFFSLKHFAPQVIIALIYFLPFLSGAVSALLIHKNTIIHAILATLFCYCYTAIFSGKHYSGNMAFIRIYSIVAIVGAIGGMFIVTMKKYVNKKSCQKVAIRLSGFSKRKEIIHTYLVCINLYVFMICVIQMITRQAFLTQMPSEFWIDFLSVLPYCIVFLSGFFAGILISRNIILHASFVAVLGGGYAYFITGLRTFDWVPFGEMLMITAILGAVGGGFSLMVKRIQQRQMKL